MTAWARPENEFTFAKNCDLNPYAAAILAKLAIQIDLGSETIAADYVPVKCACPLAGLLIQLAQARGFIGIRTDVLRVRELVSHLLEAQTIGSDHCWLRVAV